MQPHRRQPTRLLCPWDSPGKNTGVVATSFSSQCLCYLLVISLLLSQYLNVNSNSTVMVLCFVLFLVSWPTLPLLLNLVKYLFPLLYSSLLILLIFLCPPCHFIPGVVSVNRLGYFNDHIYAHANIYRHTDLQDI